MAWMEKFGGHKKAKEEGKIGDHFTNLYDQKGDEAGQIIDEANGQPIDNSMVVESADEHREIRALRRKSKSEDALGALPEKEDAAAKWLREHGDEHKEAA